MNSPRIIAGKYKGLRLKIPASSRPITDRVKTVLFDILTSNYTAFHSVLDLFSGSGNLGIEALSRGAEFAVFVEQDKKAVDIIEENISKLHLKSFQYKVFNFSTERFLGFFKETQFDLILIDPPFERFVDLKLPKLYRLVNKNGIVVIKIPTKISRSTVYLKHLNVFREEIIGENTLLFLQPAD